MRKNTSPAARTTACPKCAGTGIVTRFLDYEGGVCFDCNGTGQVAVVTTKPTTYSKARTTGSAVLTGQAVAPELVASALAFFDGYAVGAWKHSDHLMVRAMRALKDGE